MAAIINNTNKTISVKLDNPYKTVSMINSGDDVMAYTA